MARPYRIKSILLLLAATLLIFSGCGRKGPPVAPDLPVAPQHEEAAPESPVMPGSTAAPQQEVPQEAPADTEAP